MSVYSTPSGKPTSVFYSPMGLLSGEEHAIVCGEPAVDYREYHYHGSNEGVWMCAEHFDESGGDDSEGKCIQRNWDVIEGSNG